MAEDRPAAKILVRSFNFPLDWAGLDWICLFVSVKLEFFFFYSLSSPGEKEGEEEVVC
jgi:hypothetical protein